MAAWYTGSTRAPVSFLSWQCNHAETVMTLSLILQRQLHNEMRFPATSSTAGQCVPCANNDIFPSICFQFLEAIFRPHTSCQLPKLFC
ncbi:hypothetical protein LIA77_04904 [Sarocladium implicatum]|nr:hypothetical protein LIA77_04904 [Sarocladium implicatum]